MTAISVLALLFGLAGTILGLARGPSRREYQELLEDTWELHDQLERDICHADDIIGQLEADRD